MIILVTFLPGDVLVNQERGTTFNAVADITDLITVLGIVDANTLILSKAITVSSGEKLKFFKSNCSKQI